MESRKNAQKEKDVGTLKCHAQAGDYKYSVVIPVFNSQAIVDKTIDQLVQFQESVSLDYELIFSDLNIVLEII